MRRNPELAVNAAREQAGAALRVIRKMPPADVQGALQAVLLDAPLPAQDLLQWLDLERLVAQHGRFAAPRVGVGQLLRGRVLHARHILAVHEEQGQIKDPEGKAGLLFADNKRTKHLGASSRRAWNTAHKSTIFRQHRSSYAITERKRKFVQLGHENRLQRPYLWRLPRLLADYPESAAPASVFHPESRERRSNRANNIDRPRARLSSGLPPISVIRDVIHDDDRQRTDYRLKVHETVVVKLLALLVV